MILKVAWHSVKSCLRGVEKETSQEESSPPEEELSPTVEKLCSSLRQVQDWNLDLNYSGLFSGLHLFNYKLKIGLLFYGEDKVFVYQLSGESHSFSFSKQESVALSQARLAGRARKEAEDKAKAKKALDAALALFGEEE